MADRIDFAPLSDDERDAAAEELGATASRAPTIRHLRPPEWKRPT